MHPVQLSNTYSDAGVAVIEAISPSSYCLLLGLTIPPSIGLEIVVRVYIIGSLLQEIISKKNKKYIFRIFKNKNYLNLINLLPLNRTMSLYNTGLL